MNGWLVQQLPRVLSEDPIIAILVGALEEVSDSVSDRVDGIEDQLDVDLASPEMLRYIASWLGLELEPSSPGSYQRSIVKEVGQLLGQRGTRHGVERFLAAATGCAVVVTDRGGVFIPNESLPPADPTVSVTISGATQLSEQQVRRLLEDELPLGCRLELTMNSAVGGAT